MIINMNQYKVLIITDSHLRDVDFSTMQGSKSAVETLFMETLLNLIKDKNITHIIHTGDLVDKGYRNIGAALAHQSLIEEFAKAINYNFYMVLGNHFFREMLSNPELYWIQPHPVYKPNETVYRKTQLIKTPKELILNKTQISLFHFNPRDKNYYNTKKAGINFHIGIYHDDVCIPISVCKELNIPITTSLSYFDNINLAIHGHIHVPHKPILVNKIPHIIPGSTALTSTSEVEYHDKVDLPLLTIEENNCHISFVTVPLGINKYRFMKKRQASTHKFSKELKKFIETVDIDNIYSIADFIRKGDLPLHYIQLVTNASRNTLTQKDFVNTILTHGPQVVELEDINMED